MDAKVDDYARSKAKREKNLKILDDLQRREMAPWLWHFALCWPGVLI